jgi:hypothetical protein
MLSSGARMRFFRTVMLAAMLFVPSIAARAAVVEMLNGDRISGKIIGRDDKNLHINSPILGELVVPLSSVSKIIGDSSAQGAAAIAAQPQPVREQPSTTPPTRQEAEQASANVSEAPKQPPQRLSDRGKYRGKKYFLPAAIDFIRKISSMYNLKSSFKVGMNSFSSSTDYRSVNVALTVERKWLMHEFKLDYGQDYAESVSSSGVKTVTLDKLKTALRYRYNLNKRTYFQSDTKYGYSRVNDIDHDYLQSVGFGRRVVQTALWDFNVTPMMSWQYQVIDGEKHDPSLAPTLYEEAEYRWTDTVKVRNEFTAFFPVTGESQPSYHFMLSLKNKLIGDAFINFDYLFDYDGTVEDKDNAMQQTLRVSFGMDF